MYRTSLSHLFIELLSVTLDFDELWCVAIENSPYTNSQLEYLENRTRYGKLSHVEERQQLWKSFDLK